MAPRFGSVALTLAFAASLALAACSMPPQVISGQAVAASAPTAPKEADSGCVFSTWEGSLACADTLGAAWLIKRFVNPEARFRFYARETMTMEGTLFSVPQAELVLSGNRTTFECVVEKYGLKDPVLPSIGRLLRDIELNQWGEKAAEETKGLEAVLAGLTIVSENDEQDHLAKGMQILDYLYARYKSSAQ